MKWLYIVLLALAGGSAVKAQETELCRATFEGTPEFQRLPNQKVYWPGNQNAMHNGPDYHMEAKGAAEQEFASKHYYLRFRDELPPYESAHVRGYDQFNEFVDEEDDDPMSRPGDEEFVHYEDIRNIQVYYPDRSGDSPLADYSYIDDPNDENDLGVEVPAVASQDDGGIYSGDQAMAGDELDMNQVFNDPGIYQEGCENLEEGPDGQAAGDM